MSSDNDSAPPSDVFQGIQKVLLGARDFKTLAAEAVSAIAGQLKGEGVAGVALFRVHARERELYAYAYSTEAFAAVDRLFPKKFDELSVSFDEANNLLSRTARECEKQEGVSLNMFAMPTLSATVSTAIQKTIGAKRFVSYPVTVRSGKADAVVFFALHDQESSPRLEALLEACVSQLEAAYRQVISIERSVSKYKKHMARAGEGSVDEPTIRFTLRISPAQDTFLEKRAEEEGTTKTDLLRQLIDTEKKRHT